MFKQILLLCCVSTLTISCGLDYDGNTRNLYKGIVVDGNSTPLKDIPVTVVMYNNSLTEEIAYTYTDANGYFRVTAPRSKNGIPKVIVNKLNDFGNDQVPEVSSVTFHNINQATLNNYTENLGTIALAWSEDSVEVTINPTDNIKKINLLGRVINNSIDLDFALNLDENIHEVYPYNNYYFDRKNIFYVNKNQTIIIRYQKNNGEINEQSVVINNQDITVTLP